MVKSTRELTKEEFVNQYMFDFKSLIFKSYNAEKITAKQEKLLECEKKIAVLFYETYKRKKGYPPDEKELGRIVQRNFLDRLKLFRVEYDVISEEKFCGVHVQTVKQQLPLEKYRADDLSYILGREKKVAFNYFLAHDDFPMGYEELMISRSKKAVTQGLEELREEFMERYHKYYKKMERRGVT
ncbi:hypothetical protein DVX84_12660 [Enterococcus faecalis]|nr:hypothetical protein EG867_04750 [Enterococcus faecalis]TKM96332.1 hypothetical protein DVW74_05125 [Enterococcus faecalis]TKN93047.1 hypothetical protein DVX60_03355 [Enterococcus faecalis]TKO04933.1 hypothetical protein DVX71_03050 [Enterococcus faecalis]TKO22006.1 hypothetical protein DVX59_03755 [Enterococcus faecalis]